MAEQMTLEENVMKLAAILEARGVAVAVQSMVERYQDAIDRAVDQRFVGTNSAKDSPANILRKHVYMDLVCGALLDVY